MNRITNALGRLGLFPDTATGEQLDLIAAHFGLSRFEATKQTDPHGIGYANPESDQSFRRRISERAALQSRWVSPPLRRAMEDEAKVAELELQEPAKPKLHQLHCKPAKPKPDRRYDRALERVARRKLHCKGDHYGGASPIAIDKRTLGDWVYVQCVTCGLLDRVDGVEVAAEMAGAVEDPKNSACQRSIENFDAGGPVSEIGHVPDYRPGVAVCCQGNHLEEWE